MRNKNIKKLLFSPPQMYLFFHWRKLSKQFLFPPPCIPVFPCQIGFVLKHTSSTTQSPLLLQLQLKLQRATNSFGVALKFLATRNLVEVPGYDIKILIISYSLLGIIWFWSGANCRFYFCFRLVFQLQMEMRQCCFWFHLWFYLVLVLSF